MRSFHLVTRFFTVVLAGLTRVFLGLLLLGMIAVPGIYEVTPAAAQSTQIRPLKDFLDAQGTTSNFVPPVPDYVGWVDGDFITFALIDYAGLANEFIETQSGAMISLGTRVRGSVREREEPDGRATVSVQLITQNALAWAFLLADADFNDPLLFLNTPLTFGARAQDVLDGAEPSLANSVFHVQFMNAASGAPLPDLVQLLNEPQPEQTPFSFSFRANALGTRPDGMMALLRVRQVCSATSDDGQVMFSCPQEVVDLRSLGEME